jgi:hypothetical protein
MGKSVNAKVITILALLAAGTIIALNVILILTS